MLLSKFIKTAFYGGDYVNKLGLVKLDKLLNQVLKDCSFNQNKISLQEFLIIIALLKILFILDSITGFDAKKVCFFVRPVISYSYKAGILAADFE